MASENYQETDHKTSQETWSTSLLLQTGTGIRTLEHLNLSCVQWKLMGGNRSPKGNPSILWFRILRHNRNQNLFHHHEYKERIVDITQKLSRHHLSPIEETRRKSDLEYMLLQRNHK